MNFKDNGNRFDSAVNVISGELRAILEALPEKIKNDTYEVRLRSSKPVVLFGKYGSAFLCHDSSLGKEKSDNPYICSPKELTDTFKRICCYSVHSCQNSIINGYVTIKGGHRAGLCGTAVCDMDNNLTGIRDISCVNIRIARQIYACANEIIEKLYCGECSSILIAGPPSSGKTTILRDMVRQLSSFEREYPFKIAVVDERHEIADVDATICQRDVGENCDVLDGYPKKTAIMTALKTLSPEIIAVDEVGTRQEIEAIREAVNSGVRFITTIHASSFDELINRPQIEELLFTYSFSHVVLLKSGKIPCRIEGIYESGELRDEIYRRRADVGNVSLNWSEYSVKA